MIDRTIGNTIIAQLGGRSFSLFTGAGTSPARGFVFEENGVSFGIGTNCHRINRVRVVLDRGSDTYEVQFIRVRKSVPTIASEHKDVYCEDLQDLFEEKTGMIPGLRVSFG
jgi:hypothetical protein